MSNGFSFAIFCDVGSFKGELVYEVKRRVKIYFESMGGRQMSVEHHQDIALIAEVPVRIICWQDM